MTVLAGVSYDIVTRIIGVEAAASRVVREANEAGAKAGEGFSNAYTRGMERAQAATRAVETQLQSAATVAERASAQVVAAKNKELDSIGRVRAAESKLAADRTKYFELAAAESGASAAKIESANARVVASEEMVARTQRARATIGTELAAATQAQVVANDALAASQARVSETSALAASGAAATKTSWAAGALVMGLAVSSAVKSAADFESSQTRLVASAGETEEGLKEVSDGILKLAGEVGYSAQELSKGMYTVESAGYHGADGVKVMRAAAQGARAENADLTEVNNGLTTSMHDFGYSADEAADVMSKMVVAVGHSKENFQNFSGSLHSVEPAAAAAKISLEDVYGVLAMMTQTGMSADQATQNMRNAINSLSNPTQQMRDQMAAIGLNADDLKMKLGERGLAGSMQEIDRAVREHMSPAGQIIIDTFYKNQQAVEDAQKMFDTLPPAAQRMAQSVLDGTESFKDYRKEAGGLDVLTKNQVDQWLQLQKKISGYSGQLKSGKSEVENYQQAMKLATGTVAGQTVALSVVGEHAEKANGLIAEIGNQSAEAGDKVKGWHEIQGNLNLRIDRFKDSIGALMIRIGTDLLPVVSTFVGWLADAASWLSQHKTLLEGLFVALNPLLAAFLGIRYAYQHWEWFRDLVREIWDVMQQFGSWVSTAFTAVWDGVATALDNIGDAWGAVTRGWDSFIDSFSGGSIWDKALAFPGDAAGKVVGFGKSIGGWLKTGLSAGAKSLGSGVVDAGQWLGDIGGDLTKRIREINWAGMAAEVGRGALRVGEAVGDAILRGLSAVGGMAARVATAVRQWFNGIDWQSVVSSIGNGLTRAAMGIGDMLHVALVGIGNGAELVASAIGSWISGIDWGQIASNVLSGAFNFGQLIGGLIGDGIKATTSLGQKVVEWFTNVPNTVAGWVSSVDWTHVFSNLWSWTNGSYEKVTKWLRGIAGDIIKWVSSVDWFNVFSHILSWMTDTKNQLKVAKYAAIFVGVIFGAILAVVLAPGAIIALIGGAIITGIMKGLWDKSAGLRSQIAGWFRGALHGVTDAWNWVTGEVSRAWNTFMAWLRGKWQELKDAWNDVYNTAIKPVVDLIKQRWQDLQNAWGTVWNAISSGWNTLKSAWNAVYDEAIKPVGDKISSVWTNIKTGLGDMVEWMQTQWNRVQGIVETPARFIVETVYDKGIAPLWNGIAKVFNLGTIPNDIKFSGGGVMPGYAGGGVHEGAGVAPGYAPGVDSVPARLRPGMGVLVPEAVRGLGPAVMQSLSRFAGGGRMSGGVNAMISPGEATIEPDAVSAIGGPKGLWAINHMFSGGRPNANGAIPGFHFAPGGIKGDTDGDGKISEAEKDAIGRAVLGGGVNTVEAATDKIGDIAAWAVDPVGRMKKLFQEWIDKASGTPDGGSPNNLFRQALVSVPGKMLDGAINMIKGWFSAHPGAGQGGGAPAAPAQVIEWIKQALAATGVPATPAWINGLQTLVMRESGGNPRAINLTDSNAAAGHPSKGLAQNIQGTFDANHQPGTSNDIYDPVASVAAAINNARHNYGVSEDGHDLAAKIQQADPGRGPKGYAGGGVAGLKLREVLRFDGGGVAPTMESGGPVNALNAVKASPAVYGWGGGDLASLVDCSGLVGDAQLEAMGQRGDHRLGTTMNILDGSWPNFIPGASDSDIFKVGANAEHMAATILGTNIEARTTGEKIRIGADAVAWNDPQFTVTGHIDPAVFNPPYVPGNAGVLDTSGPSSATSASTPSPETAKKIADLQTKITSATNAMNKDLADAKAAQAAIDSDLANAGRSDEMAATAKTAALRVKYTAEATKHRATADQHRATLQKEKDDAEAEKRKIADYQAQITALQSGTVSDTSAATSSGSGTGTENTGLTFHDFGSRLGGIAADAISQSFSLGNIGPDLITSSPLFKIGAAVTQAKVGQPYTPSILTNPNVKVITPESHDEGGYLPNGISVISKGTKKPEFNLGPEGTEKLHRLLDSGSTGGAHTGPLVNIERLEQPTADGQATGRQIARHIAPYAQKRPR